MAVCNSGSLPCDSLQRTFVWRTNTALSSFATREGTYELDQILLITTFKTSLYGLPSGCASLASQKPTPHLFDLSTLTWKTATAIQDTLNSTGSTN